MIKEIVMAAESGFYDGVHFDSWRCCDLAGYYDYDTETQARTDILKGIREQVHPDFLIMVNTNRDRPEPEHVPYLNGLHMETVWGFPLGHPDYPYAVPGIYQIERTLSWAVENLRQTIVNCLEGFGIAEQDFDSPDNIRWMRLFATMSLTLDNGTVLYNKGKGHGHSHHWYDFWDADLGQPIGPKALHYLVEGRHRYAGLYIRKFTNGWAVYNRSGQPVEIELPDIGVTVSNKRYATTHTVAALDGDIFLRSHPTNVGAKRRLLTTSWAEIKHPNFLGDINEHKR